MCDKKAMTNHDLCKFCAIEEMLTDHEQRIKKLEALNE